MARGADADAIRKAFRKKAKALHPDQNPGDKAAEENFKRVTGAFDILGDPEKKARFDRGEIDGDGNEKVRGFPGGGGAGPSGAGGYQSGPFGGFGQRGFEGTGDFDDFLSQVMGRESGAAGAERRSGGFGGFGSGKGADVRATLEIEIEEALHGAKRRVAFSDGRMIEVTIPASAVDGQTLRLKGQGAPGAKSAGDALIELKLKAHAVFKREGPGAADLSMDLPVTLYDAVLGAKVSAPTPDGAVTLTLPKGSSSGRVLKLKAKGAAATGGGRGDLYAKVMVALPEGDEALERLAKAARG